MLTLHSLLLVIHGFCRSPNQTRSKLRSPTKFCDSILQIFLLYNVLWSGGGERQGEELPEPHTVLKTGEHHTFTQRQHLRFLFCFLFLHK